MPLELPDWMPWLVFSARRMISQNGTPQRTLCMCECGRRGWPVLPFALLLTTVAATALCGHTDAVAASSAAHYVHTVSAVFEWACAILFHLALMLPPERPADAAYRLL